MTLAVAAPQPGTGANKFSYWVASVAGAPWTKLPRVTPHMVTASAGIRRYLTGSLDAPVAGHPPFPGKEAGCVRGVRARGGCVPCTWHVCKVAVPLLFARVCVCSCVHLGVALVCRGVTRGGVIVRRYLRAIIARISAETALAPAGVYAPVEDSLDIQPNPVRSRARSISPTCPRLLLLLLLLLLMLLLLSHARSVPLLLLLLCPQEEEIPVPNLRVGAGWVHATLPLNRLGRTSANPPKIDAASGEPIDDKTAPPPPKVLKSLAGEDAAFNIRPCHESGDATGALIAVRSLRWPGAITVGSSMKRYVSFYAGYGLPYTPAPHQPAPPAGLAREYDGVSAHTGDARKALVEAPDVVTAPAPPPAEAKVEE